MHPSLSSFLSKADPFAITGMFYSQLAMFDLATNQTTYESALDQYFQIVTGYGLAFGHAAAKAYTAEKNFTLTKVCQNAPMVGGTWTPPWRYMPDGSHRTETKAAAANRPVLCPHKLRRTQMSGGRGWEAAKRPTSPLLVLNSNLMAKYNDEPNDPRLESYATGYFLGLSALLAEITLDKSYLQAATESADFILSQLSNVRHIVEPDMSASVSDSPCDVFSDTTPFGSGLLIEGLAVLTSLTKNTSMQNLLDNFLAATIPNTAWQGENGIFAVHGETGDTNLLQGLGAAYQRNVTSPAMHEYIGDYIAVQFNAVTQLATSDGSNIYAGSWKGPQSSSFSGTNQTMALTALINAIGVEDDDESATSSTTPTASSPTPPPTSSGIPSSITLQKGSPHLGAIIGGALGGVAAISLIFATLWCLRARNSRTPKDPVGTPLRESEINPFTAQVASSGLPPIPLQAGGKRLERSLAAELSTTHMNLSSNISELGGSPSRLCYTHGTAGHSIAPALPKSLLG
ncbi:hypothetical protein B0H19DRAFT_1260284 [Mycena capillaripes]|nr:hypothetical protein B0H19DRAFT_1260284 [Mycena capillaripes]